MPPAAQGITNMLHQIYPLALPIIQWLCVVCICFSGFSFTLEILNWPFHRFIKSLAMMSVFSICGVMSWLILNSSALLVAKLAVIFLLISGGCACLAIATQAPRLLMALKSIEQECELATNLTFLQGEMTRAQLEQVSKKLQEITQPSEKEVTEGLLQSISPFVMLYFRKEKNIVAWAMAAVKMGKSIFRLLEPPEKAKG
jgi:hypothetical protein